MLLRRVIYDITSRGNGVNGKCRTPLLGLSTAMNYLSKEREMIFLTFFGKTLKCMIVHFNTLNTNLTPFRRIKFAPSRRSQNLKIMANSEFHIISLSFNFASKDTNSERNVSGRPWATPPPSTCTSSSASSPASAPSASSPSSTSPICS